MADDPVMGDASKLFAQPMGSSWEPVSSATGSQPEEGALPPHRAGLGEWDVLPTLPLGGRRWAAGLWPVPCLACSFWFPV